MRFFSRKSRSYTGESDDSISITDEKGPSSGSSAPKRSNNDPEFGLSPTTKTFYEGKGSRPPHYNWVDSPPKTLSKKIAKSHDRVALKIFKVKDHSQTTVSGKTPLKIYMLDLQSPVLVEAIKDIVQDEGVYLEGSETARFMEPFKPLFFCYDKIVSLWKDEKEGTVLKNHLKLLVQVMRELFDSTFTKLRNLRGSGLINFSLAWTYFPRNCVVFAGLQDCNRVVRVVDTNYAVDKQGKKLEIKCEEIAFDGEKFDWRPITVSIRGFAGNQPVISMSSYPLSFHEDQNAVKRVLKERARKILQYQDLEYREYEGVGLLVEGCEVRKHNVSGRVLIDHFGYHKHHEGLVRKEAAPPPPLSVPTPQQYNDDGTVKKEDDDKKTYVERLSEDRQKDNVEEMMKREGDLIFMSPILEGFSLKAKVWLKFYIDDIKPVTWNDSAYTHLVYPEEQKDLVLTFVENHQRLKHGMDDVIMGKGQGLIFLLSGPPGTGKTLTAEAVADKTRRPLYYLQAEDLGTNAAYLGPKIKKVFEMATEWNAVILLDEADVFMAERSPADIARNELVSIFLRELEYYQGIIFLTTNLYKTIDIAFRSRVNIHLLFNPLEVAARKILWGKFLGKLPGGEERQEIGDEVMQELAKWELNGREIKNAVKTVRTWCVCKGFGMNLERLEAGIRVTAPQAKKCLPSYPSIYKPLQDIRKELRLLTLHPVPRGKEDAIIECTLSTHSLLPPHPEKTTTALPSYDALSYEWGAPTSSRRETNFQGEPFLIRENLWQALHCLRSARRKRIIWIDALCINQQDNNERGHQVQLMSTIYSCAHLVHVWLGQDNSNISEAFDLLQIIWRASGKRRYTQLEEFVCSRQLELSLEEESTPLKKPENYKSGKEKQVATIHGRIEERRSVRWYDIDLMRLLMEEYSDTQDWDLRAWQSIEDLLQLSYWRRIWIVQEFVLAQRMRIHCGSHSVDWEVFDGAISHILRFKTDRFPETHFIQHNFWIISRSAGSKVWEMRSRGRGDRKLLELLEACRTSECSDVRDKVYALLGLAKDVGLGAIEVDYTKPPLMLVTDVVQYYRRRRPGAELSYITSLLFEMVGLVS